MRKSARNYSNNMEKERCPYCEPEEGKGIKELPNESDYVHTACIITTPITRRKGYALMQCMDCLNNVLEYKIHYCPICGRKLHP